MAGATGTGKTVGIAQIIETLLRRGDRAIIVDPNGAFLSRFYFPGDVVLNPFDKRSEAWSIFNELRDEYDFKRYALSVVPEGLTDDAEEWNGYARLLFQAATRKMARRGNTTVVHLIKLLTAESEDSLKEFLADTGSRGAFRRRQGSPVERALHSRKVSRPSPVSQGGRCVLDPALAGGRKRRQSVHHVARGHAGGAEAARIDMGGHSVHVDPEPPEPGSAALDGDRRAGQPAEAAVPRRLR